MGAARLPTALRRKIIKHHRSTPDGNTPMLSVYTTNSEEKWLLQQPLPTPRPPLAAGGNRARRVQKREPGRPQSHTASNAGPAEPTRTPRKAHERPDKPPPAPRMHWRLLQHIILLQPYRVLGTQTCRFTYNILAEKRLERHEPSRKSGFYELRGIKTRTSQWGRR